MNSEERIIDFIYGNPSSTEVQQFKSWIDKDSDAKQLYEQYVAMKSDIQEIPQVIPDSDWVLELAHELETRKTSKAINGKILPLNTLYRITAIAAVLFFGFIGFMQMNQTQKFNQVDQELAGIHQMMESSLSNQSVSERIRAVNYSDQAPQIDNEIIHTLSRFLVEDPSPHVRLAASEALSQWIDIEYVRENLIKALKIEKDPSVQISIITALSTSFDDNIKSHFDDIIKDENTLQFVKEEAELGKFRMENNLKIL